MQKHKPAPNRLGEILDRISGMLNQSSDTPLQDAQMLLSYALKRPRTWLLAHLDESMRNEGQAELEKILPAIMAGEPVPYILGHQGFFGMEFQVNRHVLIPRPETELLVEQAIQFLKRITPGRHKVDVIDIGTGSGCIAISLAVNIPGINITATDISFQALEIARQNAQKLHPAGKIRFIQSNLFANHAIEGKFDLIVSNPPYIPMDLLPTLAVSKYEPNLALNGGMEGMEIITRLLIAAIPHLKERSLLLMEMEASQGEKAIQVASGFFPKGRIRVYKDLTGNDRLLEIQQ